MAFRFQLEKRQLTGKTPQKIICPSCGQKTLARYFDTLKNEYCPPEYGRCDREVNCAYHLNPYRDGYGQNERWNKKPLRLLKQNLPAKPLAVVETSFVDWTILERSLGAYEKNQFVQFLFRRFGKKVVEPILAQYFVGTSNQFGGSTVFWQVDNLGKVRTGKIMVYNRNGGENRDKIKFNWVHKVLKLPSFNLNQVLFGLHLTALDKEKPIAVVESEKSALIAALYLPQYLWLACGGAAQLSEQKLEPIKDRVITFWPDLGKTADWQAKANELEKQGFAISVFDFLERTANEQEKEKGLDIADYLLQFEPDSFNTPKNASNLPVSGFESTNDSYV